MAKRVRLTLDDIHPVYRSTKRVTNKQLDALERELGSELPRGYRAFLSRFGHGWVNDWLQIYCPGSHLLNEQRESLVQDFLRYARDYDTAFDPAKLTVADMHSCVQVGINQDLMRLFACRRFPGSVFAWSGLTITRYKAGFEVFDPFAAMLMGRFAYFFPLEPVPVSRSLACQSKRLGVREVVDSVQDLSKSDVQIIDVDEGPGVGSRSPAFWLFPQTLGAKLHVYGVETGKDRRVYLTFSTSPKHLPKVEALIGSVSHRLGVRFKPARWH